MVLMIYLQINQENYYYCIFILISIDKNLIANTHFDSKMCSLWEFGHHQGLQFSHKNVFKQFIMGASSWFKFALSYAMMLKRPVRKVLLLDKIEI